MILGVRNIDELRPADWLPVNLIADLAKLLVGQAGPERTTSFLLFLELAGDAGKKQNRRTSYYVINSGSTRSR